MQNSRVTLQDVARHAGVSPMTVSRAIRGLGPMRADTLERVLQSVSVLGYRPDPVLSALAGYRTNRMDHRNNSILVLLKPQDTEFVRHIESGVRNEAIRFGYSVESHPWPATAKAQRALARVFYHRGIRGIFLGPDSEPVVLTPEPWRHFAMISLGALISDPAVHAVHLDYFDGLLLAARHLEAAGYRRLGLQLDPARDKRTGFRWTAAYHVVERHLDGNLKPVPPWLHPLGEKRGIVSWLRRHKIDCLLTLDKNILSLPTLRNRIPHTLGIAFLNAFAAPEGAAHVSLDPRDLGLEGVRQMHHLLLSQEYGFKASPRTVALLPRWAPGWSCANAPRVRLGAGQNAARPFR